METDPLPPALTAGFSAGVQAVTACHNTQLILWFCVFQILFPPALPRIELNCIFPSPLCVWAGCNQRE